METNLNSWFHNQLAHPQSSNINSSSSPLSLGKLNSINPPFSSPNENIAWLKGSSNEIAFNRFPYPYPKQAQPEKNHETTNIAGSGSRPGQKRFLVFDQSGDQTTMFYSPVIGSLAQLPSEVPIPKPENVDNTNKILNRETFQHQDPIFTYAYNEVERDEMGSEMHEDTEELNALLYSDDEYYEDEEEEEEASTGHSPSTLTHFDIECGEDREEVASNFGPNKRIKLSNGDFEVSPLSSANPKSSSECEDDAESSCGDGGNQDLSDFRNLGVKKRSREDQIRETLSLLQRIIPGGKGMDKDVILIFDEAINYLISLKAKAQGLGVHTI